MTPTEARIAALETLVAFEARHAPRTVAAYRADLADFARFRGADDDARGRAIETALADLLVGGASGANGMARVWQGALRRRYAATTVNRRLSTLRSLLADARDLGHIDWRLHLRPLPTMALRETAGPGREKVREMFRAARAQGGAKGIRDVAILLLLYGLGLRRGEALELTLDRLDARRRRLSILAKGRVEREWIALPRAVRDGLVDWVRVRPPGPGPLLTSLDHARRGGCQGLTASGMHEIVARLGKAVGVRVTPHGLRHSAITDAIAAGHSLPDVQTFSRHRDLRVLQRYYDAAAGVAEDIGAGLLEGLD